eukprot:1573980-Pyramimonas_sp.AAC.1
MGARWALSVVPMALPLLTMMVVLPASASQTIMQQVFCDPSLLEARVRAHVSYMMDIVTLRRARSVDVTLARVIA